MNMGYDWDGYEKSGYIGEGNIKDIWTIGRARNMESEK